jgi:hypothetical protein
MFLGHNDTKEPLSQIAASLIIYRTLFSWFIKLLCAPTKFSLATCLSKAWGGFTLLPVTQSFWLSYSSQYFFLKEKERLVYICSLTRHLPPPPPHQKRTNFTVFTFMLLEIFWRNLVWSLCRLICSVCPKFLGNTYWLVATRENANALFIIFSKR